MLLLMLKATLLFQFLPTHTPLEQAIVNDMIKLKLLVLSMDSMTFHRPFLVWNKLLTSELFQLLLKLTKPLSNTMEEVLFQALIAEPT